MQENIGFLATAVLYIGIRNHEVVPRPALIAIGTWCIAGLPEDTLKQMVKLVFACGYLRCCVFPALVAYVRCIVTDTFAYYENAESCQDDAADDDEALPAAGTVDEGNPPGPSAQPPRGVGFFQCACRAEGECKVCIAHCAGSHHLTATSSPVQRLGMPSRVHREGAWGNTGHAQDDHRHFAMVPRDVQW